MIDTRPSGSPPSTEPAEFRTSCESVELLRHTAAAGQLTSVHELSPPLVASLRRAAYEVAWPLVWSTHTRPLEGRKGHRSCTRSVAALADGCLDGFHDDVEAVVDYLFSYGRPTIGNIEGWIVSRIGAATVDGNRRRRGLLGAQQRPRVPGWLATALRQDPWLVTLSRLIIEWVGVRATAGNRLWPVDAWGEVRDRLVPTGGHARAADVERDVEHVLTVMRTERPRWYASYVEAPLGRKQAPVITQHIADQTTFPLALTGDDVRDDAALTDLADVAIVAIQAGLSAGEEPQEVIERVLSAVFLGPASVSTEIGDVPLARSSVAEPERPAFTSDDAFDGLVRTVLAIVTDGVSPTAAALRR